MEKKLAVRKLHLTDGRILHNQVIVFEEGKYIRNYPLNGEEAFTVWYGGELNIEEILQYSLF